MSDFKQTIGEISKKRVLVVEDEQDLRDALVTALEEEGFDVYQAADGTAALKFAFEHKPDLILLDLVLPYMSGQKVLEELRNDTWGKYVKIIVLSALADIDTVSETLEYGAHEYLVKTDWRLEDIVKRVKERLLKNA